MPSEMGEMVLAREFEPVDAAKAIEKRFNISRFLMR